MSFDNQNFPPQQPSFPPQGPPYGSQQPPGWPPPTGYQNYSDYGGPPQKSNTVPIVIGVVCGCGCLSLCIIGILIALLLPAVQAAREAARRMQCTNHLKQIGIALHNYHDTYGTLPPAYTTDADGKALHSWRVLILPFMEHESLYEQLKLDEPWDSPHNSRFHEAMPMFYACPSSRAAGKPSGDTSYKWIVGPNTISDGPGALRFNEVTNGLSNVIGVVEVHPTTNWMEPVDIPQDDLDKGINWSKTEGIGSRHPGGINVLLMDGSVRFFSNTISLDVLKQMAQATSQKRSSMEPNRFRPMVMTGPSPDFEERMKAQREQAEARRKEFQERVRQGATERRERLSQRSETVPFSPQPSFQREN